MTTRAEPTRAQSLLALAWFEGTVVSLGAISGIVSTRFDAFVLPSLPIFTFPTPVRTLFWLLAYALMGWLGWRIGMGARHRLSRMLWLVVLAGMLAWRPLFSLADSMQPATMVLTLSSIAMALLMPLVASFSLAAGWTCLLLLLWLGSRSAALIYLTAFV